MDKFTLTLIALGVFVTTVNYLMTNDGGKKNDDQKK